MLKVVEKTHKSPVRIFAKPGVKFKSGHIATLKEYKGNLVGDLCRNADDIAFGIVSAKKYVKGEEISFYREDLLTLWPQRGVYQTDNYCIQDNFAIGDRLYFNKHGLLTNKPGKFILGHLISTAKEDKKFIEFLWL